MSKKGWIKPKDKLPKRWERVAVILLNEIEPQISHIDQHNFFGADGRDIKHMVWVNVERQVIWWTPLPPFPKEIK